MLHGWGGDKNSLLPQAQVLSKEYTVTAVDLYGFGETPHPSYPLNINDYVDGVFDLVKKYKMHRVALVGHSFGGRVAMAFALRYPTFISKLVLIDASGISPRRGIVFGIKVLINKIYKAIGKKPPFVSKDYNALQGVTRKTFVNVVNAYFDDDKLHHIRAKTLIIWGKDDKETPIYMAKRLKKRIKNSRLIVFSGGHFAYLENSLAVAAELGEFLGE